MGKVVLAGVLAELGPFKWYPTGKKGEHWQLRYTGPCPKCGKRTWPYWRQLGGGWRCPSRKCLQTFPTREVPGILDVLEKVDSALLDL